MKTEGLACVTIDTGFFKEGVPCVIVAGGQRTVFLGPTGLEVKTVIPEFTLEFDDGKRKTRREFCQYGRDFVFANSDSHQNQAAKREQ